MNKLVRSALLAGLSVLGGCADSAADWPSPSYYSQSHDAYSRSDLDELLGFGAAFANKSPAARAEECRQLLKRSKANPDIGVRLHLLVARTLSEACGDRAKIIASVGGIPPDRLPDGRVQNLIAIQMETLRHGASVSRKTAATPRKTERKQATVRAPDTKEAQKNGVSTDEAKI